MSKKSKSTTRSITLSTAPSWVARVNQGLTMRATGEAMIAKALRERLDQVGEARWLLECEAEWGWSRTTAYNHLNPELLQKDRDRAAAARRSDRLNIPSHWSANRNPPLRKDGQPDQRFILNPNAEPKPITAVPPMPEQRRLIAEAKEHEQLAAEPFTPEYESEIGEGWLKTLIETFEKTSAEISGNEKALRRLGPEGRDRVRTAAQRVLDALDPKADLS